MFIYHDLENPKVKFNQVTQKTGVEQREVDNSMVILTISESNLLSCKLLPTGETFTSGKQKFRHQKSYNQTPLFLFVPKKLTFLSLVVVLFLFFTPQFTLNIKTKRSTTMPPYKNPNHRVKNPSILILYYLTKILLL